MGIERSGFIVLILICV